MCSRRAGTGTRYINPKGLVKPTGYTHLVVAPDGRTVYIAAAATYIAPMSQRSLRLALVVLWTPVLAARGQAPLDGVVWVGSTASDSYSGRGDRGTGIVYFGGGASTGRVNADTILVRARPDSGSAVVGAFLYTEDKKGMSWSYSVGAPVRLRPNVLEFAYEEAGIPLDSVAPSS